MSPKEDPAPVTDAVITPRPDGLPSGRTTRARPQRVETPDTDADASANASASGAASARSPRKRAAATAGGGAPAADERSALDLARRIVELAEDKKAADIVLLDLSGLTSLADAFVICSGGSERQLDAIADGIIGGLRDEKIKPFGREGTAASHWILVDYGSVIVHVFTPPERDFYQLERHWSEARTVLRVQ